MNAQRSVLAVLAAIAALAAIASFGGCPNQASSPEGLDPSTLPEAVRADYDVFAQRCSKCHSLARPLNSGIDTDEYWKLYVDRMRRQPASGISIEDMTPILRFLHYYSVEQRRLKAAREAGSQ